MRPPIMRPPPHSDPLQLSEALSSPSAAIFPCLSGSFSPSAAPLSSLSSSAAVSAAALAAAALAAASLSHSERVAWLETSMR